MENNKTKSGTKTKNSLSNVGSSLRESLKGFTSIKDNTNKSLNDEVIINNDEKQNSFTSIIKSPSIKTISESPIETVNQISEKISETSSSFFNITSISIFLLILFVLGFFGYIIYDFLLDGGTNINNLFTQISNLFTQISNFFTQFINNKDSKENEKADKKIIKNPKTNNPDKTANKSKSLESTIKNKKTKSIVESENSKKLIENEETNEPEPIRTDSLNSGYCYIGKVNDTRYCTKVDARSKCMSGDIYPTMEICVNPNLRA